jgi:hypothetical protein
MSGVFTLARTTGDTRGPVLVAGSQGVSPVPLRGGEPATLFATLSDAEAGGGTVVAAEYSLGAAPAAAGSGTAMAGTFGTTIVQASVALRHQRGADGTRTFWVRGRDARGNWGTAGALTVPSVAKGVVAVEDEVKIDFLATPSPNPFHGTTSVRFGLARAARSAARAVRSRRPARAHAGRRRSRSRHARDDLGRRDERGASVRAGIYFVRFLAPGRTFNARVVSL